MKNLFTLAAVTALSAASFGAQAQFTVDGRLDAAEVGTGAGKYQLASSYSGIHSQADRGLKALYVGTTDSTLNVMLVASPETTGYNALTLYLDVPNRTGIAAGTQLGGGTDNSSQLKSRPTLDMEVDYAYRVTTSPLADVTGQSYYSRLEYTGRPDANGRYNDRYLGPTNKTGTPLVISDTATHIVRARFAFQSTTSGSITTNSTSGWEFSIPLASLGGAANGSMIHMLAAYVADGGEFYSDVLPQIAGQTTDLGADPNFTTIPGNQYVTYTVNTVTSTHSATAALQAATYPNPLAATSVLSYAVPTASQPVLVDVYNSLGQKALSLLNTTQGVGAHSVALAPLQQLAPGTYLVTLRVGQALSTHRVVVQ